MAGNAFSKLVAENCKEHTETKNGFSYLSWPWAVRKLREVAPDATWEVRRFDGMPFLKTECGFFVEVAVTVDGVTLSQIHPVLDHRNQPISAPNSFHINTSIQRCLVKAIALHGLGLYIYAGEDLPEAVNAGTDLGRDPDDEPTLAQRQAALDAAVKKHQDSILCIKEGIRDGNLSKAAEAWYELTEDEMRALWVAPTKFKNAPFTTQEREIMKTTEFRKAHGVAIAA